MESPVSSKSTMPWLIAGTSLIFAFGAGILLMAQPWSSSVNVTSQRNSENQTSSSSIDVEVSRTQDKKTAQPIRSESSKDPAFDIAGSQESPDQPPPLAIASSTPVATNTTTQAPTNKPLAQLQIPGTAVVIDPPSNIRVQPNGTILCSVSTVQAIPIGTAQGEWFETTYCDTNRSGYIHQSQLSLTVEQAQVIDPPSNVRSQPNGEIICTVQNTLLINTYGAMNGWYRTDACQPNSIGYIHNSQVNIQR